VDIRTVGRELGVQMILEGSVKVEGDKTRVTAQLATVETGLRCGRIHMTARRVIPSKNCPPHCSGVALNYHSLSDRIRVPPSGALRRSLRSKTKHPAVLC